MRRLVWVSGLAACLAGCHLPAARFAAPDGWDPPCVLTLGRQVVADSTLQCFCQPLHSAWELCYEAADHVLAFGHGELGKRVLLPLHGHPGPLPPGRPLTARASPAGLPADLLPAHVRLHTDGADALLALERLIDGARHTLDVLMFEWEDDDVGRRIAAKLAQKAGPAVRVRLLADGSSNLVFAHTQSGCAGAANRVLCELATRPHVEVRRARNAFARFDHRKLVVADGRAAWTGGRNFMRRAFFEDHDISLTLSGPLVAELQQRFDHCWRDQGGEATHQPEALARADVAYAPFNAWAKLVETAPGSHQLQRALYKAVDDARQYVYVENVYFTDGRLAYKLARARRRGVDVRVVLTVQSNCTPVNRATRVLANRLLAAGVRVYLYPGTTHVKAAAVDGCWAYVGTANFDALSLRHNRELGLAFGAGPALAELEETLARDFRDEWELREPLPVTAVDYACEVLATLWL